jgi:hypothetical protein
VTTFRTRVYRGLLAASTLHLLLAVPARACPSGMAMPAASAAHEAPDMTMPMSHAGHRMPVSAVPSAQDSPAPATPDAPAKHHMPCCPSPASECQSVGCTSVPVMIVAAGTVAIEIAPALPPSVSVTHWVSFVHTPEPPPPRA